MKNIIKIVVFIAVFFLGNTAYAADPTITLKGDSVVKMYTTNTYTEAGYTANDLEDGDITSSVGVSGSVPKGGAGTFTITYSVTDLDGNSVSITRTVIVSHLGNGNPFSPTQSWGLNGFQTPRSYDNCPVWYPFHMRPCFDLTQTSWYDSQMTGLAIQMIKSGQWVKFPSMSAWFEKARAMGFK